MGRTGCECENAKQSVHSPGVIDNNEPIVLVLTDPLNFQNGSVKLFSKSELKRKQLSICRSSHSNLEQVEQQVICVLLKKDPHRTHQGALWAKCDEVRGIYLGPSQIGAFCVVDDGLPNYAAHGVLGYSEVDLKLRNEREAARGNLKELFMQRGILSLSNCPFSK